MTREQEISAAELFVTIWQARWLIVAVAFGGAVAAGLLSLVPSRKYEATVIVSPVVDDFGGSGLGGLSSIISQYGDLASLAGLSLSTESSKRAESIAILQSRALTERYIKDNNLLPILFAEKWDSKTKTWNVSDPDDVPSLWKANEVFKKRIRRVEEDKRTGLVAFTITWKDADLAAKWANDLVRLTNEYLRNKAILKSERNIAYLNDQVSKTSITEVQKAIYRLLETEIKNVMVARGNDEYALKVLDPAVAAERPSSPKPLSWIFAGLIGGMFLSTTYVLLRGR